MEHVKDSLSEYMDGELGPAQRRRVDFHLGACGDCRRALEELRALSRLVSGLPRAALPAGFRQRLERRRARPAPARLWLPTARVAAFALSSVLVTVVVYDRLTTFFPVSSTARLAPAAIRLERESAPSAPRWASLARRADAPRPRPRPFAAAPFEPAPSRAKTARLAALSKAAAEVSAPPPAQNAAFGGAAGAAVGMPASPVLQAIPLPKETPAAPEGIVIRSEEERAALWNARGLKLSPPRVSYDKSFLAIVFAERGWAVEIADVRLEPERIVVRFRESELPPTAGDAQSYQFRVLARTDLPVVFEKLP